MVMILVMKNYFELFLLLATLIDARNDKNNGDNDSNTTMRHKFIFVTKKQQQQHLREML